MNNNDLGELAEKITDLIYAEAENIPVASIIGVLEIVKISIMNTTWGEEDE